MSRASDRLASARRLVGAIDTAPPGSHLPVRTYDARAVKLTLGDVKFTASEINKVELLLARTGTRCLTVKDPWVTLIGNENKPYELRKRATHFRGWVVLCSSASPSRTDDAHAAREKWRAVYWRNVHEGWIPEPLGHALYVAHLHDCWLASARDARGACCMPQAGEYVWAFRDVRRIPTPVPVKGQLGLYYPTPRLTRALHAQGVFR